MHLELRPCPKPCKLETCFVDRASLLLFLGDHPLSHFLARRKSRDCIAQFLDNTFLLKMQPFVMNGVCNSLPISIHDSSRPISTRRPSKKSAVRAVFRSIWSSAIFVFAIC